MIVALCCTKNWYLYLAVSIFALRQTNKVKKIYCFIEDDEIPYIKNVEFINVNKLQEYIKPSSPNYNTKYSKLSYTRCYFSKVIQENKIIYLDVDAIVNGNISELWEMPVEYIAGVREPGEWDNHLKEIGFNNKYINSGVLVMNLQNIRKSKLDDYMIKLLNEKFYMYPDQDVINIAFKDKITYLSTEYNSTETTGFIDNAKIVHYIRERKGWVKTSPRSEIWYNWFKQYIEKEEKNMYIVKAITCFTDNECGVIRTPGTDNDTWEVTKERYEYLSGKNDKGLTVVELVGVSVKDEPKSTIEELPKEQEIVKPDKKETKKVTRKTTKKK